MASPFRYVLGAVLCAALLSGCDDAELAQQAAQPQQPQPTVTQPVPVDQNPQYDQQQPNVVVVQQPPAQQQSSNDGFFTGMVMGHMLSHSHGGYYGSRRTVVNNHTTIINRSPRYYGSRNRAFSSRGFSSRRSFGRRR